MNLKFVHITQLTFLLFLTIQNWSQQKEFTGDPDKAFEVARKLAFNNQRKQAQDTLLLILTKYPNYHDIRSFLANTYSWDANYKLAREAFKYILDNDKSRKEDWIGATKNELYANLPYKANEMSKRALLLFPDSEDLLLLLAKSEEKLNRPDDAINTLDRIFEINPNFSDAIEYKNLLSQSLRLNAINVGYNSVFYAKNERETAHFSNISYTRQTKYGTLIGRVNYSRRFSTDNYQYEIDLYPRIMEGFYAYASAGFSNSDYFPKSRYGLELYKALPWGLEASLGFRGLKFDELTSVYTGSLSWYLGNNYISLRTFITPNNAGSSKSGTLVYRKYYSDADNFFSIYLGLGVSPELQRLPVDTAQNLVLNLNSQKVGADVSFSSKNKMNFYGISFNLLRDEKSFSTGDFFTIYQLGFTYGVRFK